MHKHRILMTIKLFTCKIEKVPRPKNVYLVGSFDLWQQKHSLNYDNFSQKWAISLQLAPG